jgi:RNA polymerase sigma factor (sigma-70 family)
VEPSRDDSPSSPPGTGPFPPQEEAPETLDLLCGRTLAGDGAAEERLYEHLRVSFLRVAQRRVRSEDLEDVVQEALRVVHGKLRSRPRPDGVLPWSMAILRNVVGSHYRRRARQARGIEVPSAWDPAPAPDEARERTEEMDRLSRALEILSRSHPRCGVLYLEVLRSLGEAGDAGEGGSTAAMDRLLREFPGMTRGAFYVTLHRCRARLRKIVEVLEQGAEGGAGTGGDRGTQRRER